MDEGRCEVGTGSRVRAPGQPAAPAATQLGHASRKDPSIVATAGTIVQFTLLLANTPHFQALRLLTAVNPVSAPPPVPSPAPPPRLLAKATATVPLPFPTMTKASIYQQCQTRSTSSHHRGLLR